MAIESTGEIDIVWRGVQAGASYKIVFYRGFIGCFSDRKSVFGAELPIRLARGSF